MQQIENLIELTNPLFVVFILFFAKPPCLNYGNKVMHELTIYVIL